jgi:lipid-binding SYLF domain-containing protein
MSSGSGFLDGYSDPITAATRSNTNLGIAGRASVSRTNAQSGSASVFKHQVNKGFFTGAGFSGKGTSSYADLKIAQQNSGQAVKPSAIYRIDMPEVSGNHYMA